MMSKLDPDPESQLTLDDKVIEQLKQDMGEDAVMVIESYVESIDEFLSDIENRTVRTSSDDLHRWAHTIKSSAASIGAMRLAHLAAQMENSYRDRIRIDLGEQLQHMQREYQRVNATIVKITGN
jgi:HPt (histidine-containing phosphotransfer) domain-containing protein